MSTPASSHFFANTSCRYYPCHKGVEEVNCLFCYCPLYHRKDCPGTPRYKEKDGKSIKVCTDCVFPHKAESYGVIAGILKKMK